MHNTLSVVEVNLNIVINNVGTGQSISELKQMKPKKFI